MPNIIAIANMIGSGGGGTFSPSSISGLSAWYKLDQTEPTNPVIDSAYGNNGTGTNMAYETGKLGNCAAFGGTSKIAVEHNANIDDWTSLSVNFLIKCSDQTGKQYTRLIEKGTDNEYSIIMNYVTGSGKVTVQRIYTNVPILTSTNSIADDNWHMITVTVNSNYTEGKLYIDGVLDQSGNLASGTPDDPAKQHNLTLGSKASGASFYVGKMDDVTIYNKVLSQGEITQLKNYYAI